MDKNLVLKLVTFLGGIYFFLFFVLPENFLNEISVTTHHQSISKGFIVVTSMAFGIGIIHLVVMHLRKIARGDQNSFYSIFLLLSMFITFLFGIIDWQAEYFGSKFSDISNSVVKVIHQGLFIPLGSSMFALLAFYIASASFRAFRIKSVETFLLMVSAVIVILGQTPFATYLHEILLEIRNWLLTIPSTATFRGIAIGASIASLILSIRVWLSLDFNSNK